MDKSEHCKDVYAYFGHAMYRAQCVEQSIIQLIVFFDFFPKHVPNMKSADEWAKNYDQFDEFLSAKTMGGLVKNLVSLGAVEPSLEEKLRVALKKRNWLAHRFYVDHALNFVSKKGRDLMIRELQECGELFDAIEDILNPVTYSLCEKYGLTQEILQETERELFANAGGDLPPP